MRSAALLKALEILGGPAALGAILGISSQAISQWDEAPVARVLEIEKATKGKVARHELRPDIYPPPEPRKPRRPALEDAD